MIREIWSDRATYKKIRFNEGLNLVVADRSMLPSSDQDSRHRSRNGAGKSSLIDVIHFLLGGNTDSRTVVSSPALKEDRFFLRMDLLGSEIVAERSPKTPGRIVIDGDTRDWPVQPKTDEKTGEVSIAVHDWKDLLGRALFGLPSAKEIPKRSNLGFRSCVSYFARRSHDGGFQKWTQFMSSQPAHSVAVNLSFLVGLDPNVAHTLFENQRKQNTNKEVGRAIKEGFLAETIGTTAELRLRLTEARRSQNTIQNRLDGQQVIRFFGLYESEAAQNQRQIDQLNNQNVMDRELLADLAAAIKHEEPPELPELNSLYQEVGITLPDAVLASFDEVQKFHAAVVENRKAHLQDEIQATEKRIEERSDERNGLVQRQDAISEILNAGVPERLHRRTQTEFARISAEVEDAAKRLDLAEQFESTKNDLLVERAEALRALARDHQERSKTLMKAMECFMDISAELYDPPARLEITYDKTATRFTVQKDDLQSDGVTNMQIFSFDLMLATMLADRGAWPGFLIHDSHIFDGVDGRQAGAALATAHKRVLAMGGQYIATLNSDELEKIERESGADLTKFILRPKLNDTDDGGLFGFRFSFADRLDDGIDVPENDTSDPSSTSQ